MGEGSGGGLENGGSRENSTLLPGERESVHADQEHRRPAGWLYTTR